MATASNGEGARATLFDKAASWKRDMQDAAVGPLRIARDVMRIVEHWDRWGEHTDHKRPGSWLVSIFGLGLDTKFWRRRAEAIASLDPNSNGHVARTLSHQAAVYIHESIPEKEWANLLAECHRARKENGGLPIRASEVLTLYRRVFNRRPPRRRAGCAKCAEKDAEIARLMALVDQATMPALSAANE